MRENRDPLVRRGRDLRTSGDFDGAIHEYNAALDKRGDMPQAHFELAVIYHQNKKDYIRAVYHYQRFLELSPKSEKRSLVEGEMKRAKMEFAAALPDRPSEAIQTIAAMEKERELLKSRVAELQQELDKLKGRAATPAPVPGVSAVATGVVARVATQTNLAASATNAPVSAPETYIVKDRDTLAKIAREVFHDPGMAHAIFEANKATMKSERDLRAGQKIILPPRRRSGGG